ncbi:mandelate racemase/muconate lactonizing enzyme family protein [Halorarum halophilum]|uniref:Mandelate racemase/muconate lactonizing enzyme family protein n=1 Tax=Halorarum halophilum TaxID=2743090 RepID=A0A7D5GB89_9EURY|nr:mandelate racemase/muconate lactonizing enzyme family protein [Halobaculum halophilum]QLG27306.1 mandelate racemase/muconate lactonizing enzyme family protein [Halobaculum halophilum]
MEITEIESFAVSIPLEEPVSFATRTVEERDHAIVYVRTDEGHEGLGYSLGYGGAKLVADAASDVLAPMLEGEDPRDTTRLWREMFDGTVQIGRKGVMVRAISILDIALWDIKAKAAGMPLYKLLGGSKERIPAYASGGYYRESKGLEGLREEMRTYVDRGHNTVKMKVGRRSVEEEVERVRTVRETIGPDRTLLMDANGKWSNKQEAVRACRAFGEYDPYFIEEPVMPDSIDLMSEVNAALSYPVAAGELEFTRYGFEHLMDSGAVEIIQPDVTVVGGVTEWMRVANAAAARDIPVAPHYNWDLHVHLLGAIENGLWAEFFYRDSDVKAFDDVLVHPMEAEDGYLEIPDRDGHGVELDDDALEQFRI